MTGEWDHRQKSGSTSDTWTELPWVIALGFVMLWLPGALLAWRYPYGSRSRRNQARLVICTVVIPWIGGALYLLFFLGALVVGKFNSRD